MASEQNKPKSQHFLCCLDFHFVNTRKVLSGWKSLSFTDLGIPTEVGGGQSHRGSHSLCWTAEGSWAGRQHGRRRNLASLASLSALRWLLQCVGKTWLHMCQVGTHVK